MKAKALSALVSVLCLLPSCVSGPDSYYAFKSTRDGKWGMISPQGKVLFDSEFKRQPTDVIGGVFFVQTGKDNKWQIYDAINNTTSSSDDSYEFILPFNEDVTLAVKKKDYIKIIDKQGNVIAPLAKAGSDTIYAATAFHDGLSIILTEFGFGAVNTKGEVVVKPKYAFLLPFSDHVAIGMENKYKDEDEENIVFSVIDSKGETLFTFKATKYYDLAETGFHKGLLAVCKDDGKEPRWGFINKSGEEVVKPTAKNAQIGEWNDVIYVFSDGEQWGLKKISNDEVLIRCKYDKLEFADADGSLLWAGEKNNRDYKWTLINTKGESISKDSYNSHMAFAGNFCPVQVSDNEWTFINRKGEEQKIPADIYTIGGRPMEEVLYNLKWDVSYAMEVFGGMADLFENESGGWSDAFEDIYDGDWTLDEDEDEDEYEDEYEDEDEGEDEGDSDAYSDSFEEKFNLAARQLLTESDLSGLDKAELRILRNSIYARHGYIFKSDDLKAYFSQFNWYNPTSSDVSARLSDIEKKNVEFIKKHE